jgi:hypothetical protein
MSSRAPPLIGTYDRPGFRVGDRTKCLYRGREVVVTGWTTARMPWPLCRAVGSRAGAGLLVNAGLRRAVETAAVATILRWWGVGRGVVRR